MSSNLTPSASQPGRPLPVFDYALSLGPDCRTRHQLMRVFGEERCPSGVFDWQITPWRALLAYIRRDFSGLFELSDLSVEAFVTNVRFGTIHQHEFPGGITTAGIAGHFARARSRHDYLAAKTSRLFHGQDRVLLCLSSTLSPRRMARLWLTIRLRYPRLRFTLVNGPSNDDPGGVDTWRGNDTVWDHHLQRFL